MSTFFITAIDTDSGKTIVTGLLAKWLKDQRESVMTMKIAQTGCSSYSEDIEMHRKLMGEPLLAIDKAGLTCPYVFNFPASPHLSSRMEDKKIDGEVIHKSIKKMELMYEHILVEGVGGLMVPMNEDMMVIDFIRQYDLPVILVTSGKLGSVNHTLLSMEVLYQRDICIYGVVYNHYPVTDRKITLDSSIIIREHLYKYYPQALWMEVPVEEKIENIRINVNDDWFKEEVNIVDK